MANNDHQNNGYAGSYGMTSPQAGDERFGAQQVQQPQQRYQQHAGQHAAQQHPYAAQGATQAQAAPAVQPQPAQVQPQAQGQYPPGQGQAYPVQPGYPPQYGQMPATPVTSQPQQLKKKRGKGFWIAIIIAVIAIVLAIGLALWFMLGSDGSNRDRNAAQGQLEGKTAEEIQAELDRMIEEGMFNISIAGVVEMESGSSEAALKIENVPNNPYLMQVDITRDDTGEVIYESGILDPNYHIQSTPLDVVLPAGIYECTAVFHALDMEDEQEVGQAAAQLQIIVQS